MVYSATDLTTKATVAVKLEHQDRGITRTGYLVREAEFYKKLVGGIGIPQVLWTGYEGDYAVMVFEWLGPSLIDLLNYCGGAFSLKTTLMLLDQMLRRVEFIHRRGIIHRDLKPSNFLVGVGRRGGTLYLADYGLAEEYDPEEALRLLHAPMIMSSMVGTAHYASVNGHLGKVQTPRDDLESLGYVIVFIARGTLPWVGLRCRAKLIDKHNFREILDRKRNIRLQELCKGLPAEFPKYFEYVYSLTLNQTPNYGMLRNMFSNLFKREGFEYDEVYDWTVQKFMELIEREQHDKKEADRERGLSGYDEDSTACDADESAVSSDVTTPRGVSTDCDTIIDERNEATTDCDTIIDERNEATTDCDTIVDERNEEEEMTDVDEEDEDGIADADMEGEEMQNGFQTDEGSEYEESTSDTEID